IFSHMLQREFHENHIKHLSRKFTEWVYGPVHSSLYDLSSVDSYENNSVLDILIFGSDIPGILFLASTALYLGRRQEYLGFLVMCLALSWVNVLYYSRGDRHMGIYSVMIQKVGFPATALFKFTIGMGDMEFTQDYQYMEVFYVLLIAYIILTYILLLNMLIALMNRTVPFSSQPDKLNLLQPDQPCRFHSLLRLLDFLSL
ncbi:hypothetical protein GOODEAATRI_020746, partial [Goodea atripinnis]